MTLFFGIFIPTAQAQSFADGFSAMSNGLAGLGAKVQQGANALKSQSSGATSGFKKLVNTIGNLFAKTQDSANSVISNMQGNVNSAVSASEQTFQNVQNMSSSNISSIRSSHFKNVENPSRTNVTSSSPSKQKSKSSVQDVIVINGQNFRQDRNQLTPVVKNPKTGNWVEQMPPRYIKLGNQWYHQKNGTSSKVVLDTKHNRWTVTVRK